MPQSAQAKRKGLRRANGATLSHLTESLATLIRAIAADTAKDSTPVTAELTMQARATAAPEQPAQPPMSVTGTPAVDGTEPDRSDAAPDPGELQISVTGAPPATEPGDAPAPAAPVPTVLAPADQTPPVQPA